MNIETFIAKLKQLCMDYSIEMYVDRCGVTDRFTTIDIQSDEYTFTGYIHSIDNYKRLVLNIDYFVIEIMQTANICKLEIVYLDTAFNLIKDILKKYNEI